MRRPLLALTPVFLLASCAHPLSALTARSPVELAGVPLQIAYAPARQADAARVTQAVQRASPGLSKWGGLGGPVTVYLAQSHGDLECASGQGGADWLRAWARADEVIFQTPAAWPPPGPNAQELDQLVLHELTHCLTFQRSAWRGDWTGRHIPLWFREGLAISTAGQGAGFGSLEDLANFYRAHPGLDPIGHPEPIENEQHAAVYGAAFHAYTFLVRRHSEAVVERLFHSMSVGRTFAQAFEDVLGFTEQSFLDDFRHYVEWRGYKGRPGVHAATPAR